MSLYQSYRFSVRRTHISRRLKSLQSECVHPGYEVINLLREGGHGLVIHIGAVALISPCPTSWTPNPAIHNHGVRVTQPILTQPLKEERFGKRCVDIRRKPEGESPKKTLLRCDIPEARTISSPHHQDTEGAHLQIHFGANIDRSLLRSTIWMKFL